MILDFPVETCATDNSKIGAINSHDFIRLGLKYKCDILQTTLNHAPTLSDSEIQILLKTFAPPLGYLIGTRHWHLGDNQNHTVRFSRMIDDYHFVAMNPKVGLLEIYNIGIFRIWLPELFRLEAL